MRLKKLTSSYKVAPRNHLYTDLISFFPRTWMGSHILHSILLGQHAQSRWLSTYAFVFPLIVVCSLSSYLIPVFYFCSSNRLTITEIHNLPGWKLHLALYCICGSTNPHVTETVYLERERLYWTWLQLSQNNIGTKQVSVKVQKNYMDTLGRHKSEW